MKNVTVDLEKERTPDRLSGRFIIIGAGLFTGLIILANVYPYSLLIQGLINRSLGNMPIVGRFVRWASGFISLIIGFFSLVAVQSAEIRPLLLNRPDFESYLRASQIATIAYLIDLSICLFVWFPLNVSFQSFISAPMLSSVNWSNVVMIFVTLYGCEIFVKLLKGVR